MSKKHKTVKRDATYHDMKSVRAMLSSAKAIYPVLDTPHTTILKVVFHDTSERTVILLKK